MLVKFVDSARLSPVPEHPGYPRALSPWLHLEGSMTAAITNHLGKPPAVTPSFEGPGRLRPWERRLLGGALRTAYVREVALSVEGSPVLHARTLAPFDHPAISTLRRLERRPLAQMLFQDPKWRRVGEPVPLLERSAGGKAWGRACLWQWGRRAADRVLVAEVFDRGLTYASREAPAS